MLVEGGMSYIVPTLLRQIEEKGIDARKITRFLILHSHFDHCGAVPIVKREFPWMQTVASHRTAELYRKEKVINFVRERNMDMIKLCKMEDKVQEYGLDFDNIEVDVAVGEGDIIDLGDGVTSEIVEMPGHSTCSIAAYTLPDRALFASDAGGIPNHENVIHPAGNEDFILYQRSMEKVGKYPVEIHCAARFGAYTEDEGRNYMARAIRQAEDYRLRAIELVKRNGGMEKAVDLLFKEHFETSGTSDVPAEIMNALITRMVRVIMEDHEKRT
jgi:glyoxylase-like metal-dependent hydrolase (beta-lactamase superfamily II)